MSIAREFILRGVCGPHDLTQQDQNMASAVRNAGAAAPLGS
jgi:hypothetical protein